MILETEHGISISFAKLFFHLHLVPFQLHDKKSVNPASDPARPTVRHPGLSADVLCVRRGRSVRVHSATGSCAEWRSMDHGHVQVGKLGMFLYLLCRDSCLGKPALFLLCGFTWIIVWIETGLSVQKMSWKTDTSSFYARFVASCGLWYLSLKGNHIVACFADGEGGGGGWVWRIPFLPSPKTESVCLNTSCILPARHSGQLSCVLMHSRRGHRTPLWGLFSPAGCLPIRLFLCGKSFLFGLFFILLSSWCLCDSSFWQKFCLQIVFCFACS